MKRGVILCNVMLAKRIYRIVHRQTEGERERGKKEPIQLNLNLKRTNTNTVSLLSYYAIHAEIDEKLWTS